ncbi:hypothetical protein Emed_000351 [Eimeria media]
MSLGSSSKSRHAKIEGRDKFMVLQMLQPVRPEVSVHLMALRCCASPHPTGSSSSSNNNNNSSISSGKSCSSSK